ncbi:TIGR03987 family protein [Clostridium sardiniense]|uniref:TIGR03987 family protein n=1 Tax=Clostridium sardiniense TaxID=29369 RepID=A0ABS7KX81_CLOSR|nr:HsmA family protein [Clostridium sardiniense]MBY0755406.1 TIGR03987 family protein [Clostridium sardiniense]MDQ0459854.1 putative repeat protein (TIGR03987 family) [Clostridium sardiniense]
MSGKLIFAIITITLALIFYTIGVWSERKANTLKKWHVVVFWIGLLFDTTGTMTMESIAGIGNMSISSTQLAIHGITGALAIILMLFHAVWATWVLYKNDEKKKAIFHKFSIAVWFVWLVPYIIGMIIGMS